MAIFAKTIDHGSFRGAASELHLSPSVVSHHVSQLEGHLGVALMYRTTRKLTLTREGERLLAATRNMLDAVEGELQDLSASSGEPSGELRLTLPSVLTESDLMTQIADFTAKYPRVGMSLDFSDTRRELIDNRFDIAIRMATNSKNSATSRRLFTVRRKIVASKAYLATKPKIQKLEDLEQLDWIRLEPVHGSVLTMQTTDGRTRNIKVQSGLSTNDARSLYRFACSNVGLAIVPEFLADADVKAGHMTWVMPEWEVPTLDVFAVWPANAPKHGLIHLALSAFGQPDKLDDV